MHVATSPRPGYSSFGGLGVLLCRLPALGLGVGFASQERA